MARGPQANARLLAVGLIVLYALVLLAPLELLALLRPSSDHAVIYRIGQNLALVGFTALCLQFVISARFKRLERPFGLDILFRFHKSMGLLAVSLLIAHPIVMAIGEKKVSLLFGAHVAWYVWAGRIALLILLLHIVLAVYRVSMSLEYEKWRKIHNAMAVILIAVAFTHSWAAGDDLELISMRVLWLLLLVLVVLTYAWHRFARPRQLRGQLYQIIGVARESRDVWTVRLAPSDPDQPFHYLPGQFHFLTFHSAHLPREEHVFTISSSPTKPEFLTSTIKESGDFTRTIGKLQPGDTALVHGPFGRFSYVLYPEERDLVFIAGGVGITPLMSMVRHMRDTKADICVLLLYAHRGQDDLVFRHELSTMEAGGFPRLMVIPILSKAGGDWKGETGHLDEEKIDRLCGPHLSSRAFYICAPPGLTEKVVQHLLKRGVPARRIHFERFSL